MIKKIVAISFFLFGFIYFLLISQETIIAETNVNNVSFKDINPPIITTGIKFLDIFCNNIFVAFLLSIIGFCSAGILSLTILFWNGYLLSVIYKMAYYTLSFNEILYSSKHVPLEIFALILFAEIGLSGFSFFKSLLRNEINLKLIPHYSKFIFPSILLFISSIIEVL